MASYCICSGATSLATDILPQEIQSRRKRLKINHFLDEILSLKSYHYSKEFKSELFIYSFRTLISLVIFAQLKRKPVIIFNREKNEIHFGL